MIEFWPSTENTSGSVVPIREPPLTSPPTNPEPLPPQEIQELPDDLKPDIVVPESVEFPDAVPLEPDSSQNQLDTQSLSIETEPSETLEAPLIETPSEVEIQAPSIAIEPAIETTPEPNLPADIDASPMDMDIPMDMPMDIPMDIGL